MTTKSCQTSKNACNSSCRNYNGCTARLSMLDDLLLETKGQPLSALLDWSIFLTPKQHVQAALLN